MSSTEVEGLLSEGGSAYLRELENVHAVEVGSAARNEDEAVARALTILRNARVLGMRPARAAELAVLVLLAWQGRAVLGAGQATTPPRLWEVL
jgi:predicted dinucleotide-binding enzyme